MLQQPLSLALRTGPEGRAAKSAQPSLTPKGARIGPLGWMEAGADERRRSCAFPRGLQRAVVPGGGPGRGAVPLWAGFVRSAMLGNCVLLPSLGAKGPPRERSSVRARTELVSPYSEFFAGGICPCRDRRAAAALFSRSLCSLWRRDCWPDSEQQALSWPRTKALLLDPIEALEIRLQIHSWENCTSFTQN